MKTASAHMPAQHQSMTGAILMAGLIGAAIGVLTAPRKGSETRAHIRESMHNAKLKSHQAAQGAKDTAHTAINTVRGKAAEVSQDAADAATEARSQVEDAAAKTSARGRRTNGSELPSM